jgi:hypothetical protein
MGLHMHVWSCHFFQGQGRDIFGRRYSVAVQWCQVCRKKKTSKIRLKT